MFPKIKRKGLMNQEFYSVFFKKIEKNSRLCQSFNLTNFRIEGNMCVTPSINAGPESNFKPLTFTILNNSRILKNFYKVLMDLAALEFAFDQDNFDILEAFVSYKNQIFFGFKHQLHDVFRIIPEEKNFEYQNKLVDFFQGFALKMVEIQIWDVEDALLYEKSKY